MINLLPLTEKKSIFKEYRLRLSIVFVALFILSVIVGSVFLFPALFLSQTKEREAEKRLTALEQSTAFKERTAAEETVRSVNKKIDIFGADGSSRPLSELFRIVSDSRTGGVIISGFLYQKAFVEKDIVRKIVLQGTSGSREGLVSYVDALKKTASFLNVEVPTASLARSANIPFILNLTIKK